MEFPDEVAPDQPGCTLFVGQDAAGHWLVQESGHRLEGRFVSRGAALAFARSEAHAFPGATVSMTSAPLVPIISFAPVQPWETASHLRKAA